MVIEGKKIREKNSRKKRKIAWGITGSGDRIVETVKIMKEITSRYSSRVKIEVYLSKAGAQVVKYYHLVEDLKRSFDRVWIEINANSPFLAGQLQTGRFDFLLIAPTTSNSVAKIALGIADSLLSNAAIMGLKAFVPIYIMPSDFKEGILITQLPTGRDLKLRIRKEDVKHVKNLSDMEGVFVLERPEEIFQVFKKHFMSTEKE
jgi:archaeoflavoprotein AfpA